MVDIDTARVFSLPEGAPLASCEIVGSSFLNGLSEVLEGGEVTTLTKGEDLGRPNGVVETPNKQLVMVTIASGEVHTFDLKGMLLNNVTLSYNRLDGLVLDSAG